MRACFRKYRLLLILSVTALPLALLVTLLVVFLPGIGGETYFKSAAVAASGVECADVGRSILAMNGSAVDAAIAILFCDGVACAQCMGLGGGFFATTWDYGSKRASILDARETAPAASHPEMFEGGNISTTFGGMAAAVPGELRGYGALYQRYGRLPWSTLVQPTIDLCRRGLLVSSYMARALSLYKEHILEEPSMREIFLNPATEDVWKEGDILRRPGLADTLEIIAKEGPEAMHNGSLTQRFVDDVAEFQGIITVEDMNNYRPVWKEPVKFRVSDTLEAYSPPLPASGHMLAYIVNMMRGWVGGADVPFGSLVYFHRMIETFKYAFGLRTRLADPDFANITEIEQAIYNLTSDGPISWYRSQISDDRTYGDWQHYGGQFEQLEDHGTAQVSVVAENGDAVSVTSTINYMFGAVRRSRSTDIILNNEMDDFSHPGVESVYGMPPSPSNFPEPGKRPFSSMSPTIVTDLDGKVRLVIGGAGGTKIATQISFVLMSHLWFGNSLEDAINLPRIHHQLMPATIENELEFDKKLLTELCLIGHNTTELPASSGFAAITSVSVDDEGILSPRTDKRRPGGTSGY